MAGEKLQRKELTPSENYLELRINPAPEKIVKLLIILSFFLTAAGFLGDMLFTFTGRYYGLFLFKGDRKTGITVWFASMLFFSAFLLSLGRLREMREKISFLSAFVLAASFLALSIMKITGAQELFFKALRRFAVVIDFPPLVGLVLVTGLTLFFVWMLSLFRELEKRVRISFLLGGGFFLLGLVLDQISAIYGVGYTARNLKYLSLSALEEFLELVGTVFLIRGLCQRKLMRRPRSS